MRFVTAGIVGILAWTLSITFIARKPATYQEAQQTCPIDPMMDVTQQHPGIGVLSQIYNDGRTLRVTVTPKWKGLDTQAKILLYSSFICLAQKQDLPMQLMVSENE